MHKSIFLLLLLLASCKKEIIIFDSLPNENLELPLILRMNGKNCFYDSENKILKYSIDESSLINFSPNIEFQEYSAVYFNGEKLENNQINLLGTIELNKQYLIEIQTRESSKYFSLIFTKIPLVQVVTFDAIKNEYSTLAKITVNYPDQNKASPVEWADIEIRGASSQQSNKKSYGFTVYGDKHLNSKKSVSYFDWLPNSKWILDGMYVDVSRLRNKASFELWSSMNTTNHIGIKSSFVEVFINNKSVGLYCFNQKYNNELLNLNSESVFYKGTDNSPVTFFNELPNKNPHSAKWNEWEQIYPDPKEKIEWTDFKNLCELIVTGEENEFKNNIGNLVDLNNVIDYYLFINLCGGSDNVGKNMFLLKKSNSDKFILAPWDMDATWGRSPHGNHVQATGTVTNAFFDRLIETNPENFNNRVKLRWQELRSSQFSENNLLAVFLSNFTELTGYSIIDYENKIWKLNLNPEVEKAYIETWILNRLTYLDALYQ